MSRIRGVEHKPWQSYVLFVETLDALPFRREHVAAELGDVRRPGGANVLGVGAP